MDDLTVSEKARLDECEAIIEQGRETFVSVGQALAEIRDQRLYRQTHPTFEGYCRDRFNRGRDWADVTISASAVVLSLPTEIGKPAPTFSQARELAKADPADRADAWKEASADGKPTTKKARAAVQKKKVEGSPEQKIAAARKSARAAFGKMLRAMDQLSLTTTVRAELEAVLAAINGKIEESVNTGDADEGKHAGEGLQ